MRLDLDALEELLPQMAGLLGVPPEETASALRGEKAAEMDLEDVSRLVQDSLTGLIGMEVVVP